MMKFPANFVERFFGITENFLVSNRMVVVLAVMFLEGGSNEMCFLWA